MATLCSPFRQICWLLLRCWCNAVVIMWPLIVASQHSTSSHQSRSIYIISTIICLHVTLTRCLLSSRWWQCLAGVRPDQSLNRRLETLTMLSRPSPGWPGLWRCQRRLTMSMSGCQDRLVEDLQALPDHTGLNLTKHYPSHSHHDCFVGMVTQCRMTSEMISTSKRQVTEVLSQVST